MDFNLSEDQQAFAQTARQFAESELAPHAAKWDREHIFPKDTIKAAGELGFCGLYTPEEAGGLGLSRLDSSIIFEQLALGCTATTAMLTIHNMATWMVASFGTDAIKDQYVDQLVMGELLASYCLTEPGSGSDAASLKTKAVRDGDEFVINGQKTFISNGQLNDLLVLACKTDTSKGAKGISQILVTRDTPGFERGDNLQKVGYHAQDTSELFFQDCRVPVSNLLGGEGRGFVQMIQQLAQERLVVAIRSAAIIEAALQWTVEYVNQREAFGRTLADFQNTRFKLAEIKTQATITRVFIDACIAQHLDGELDAIDAAMAKMQSTETMCQVLDDCVQLHGGYGYMWEYPIARAWADNRMARIAGGSTEIMKEIIGRTLTGGGK